MLSTISLLIVVCAGFCMVALAFISMTAPARASAFLMGFASSAAAHYIELLIRIAIGLAFVAQAAYVPFPLAFSGFGVMLVVTTVGLLMVPWRWHSAFTQGVVPHALRHLRLVATASLLLGVFVLWSAFRAAA